VSCRANSVLLEGEKLPFFEEDPVTSHGSSFLLGQRSDKEERLVKTYRYLNYQM